MSLSSDSHGQPSPAGLRARAQEIVAARTGTPAAELRMTQGTPVRLPLTGAQFTRWKAFRPGGPVREVALETGGGEVDPEALAAREDLERTRRYGKKSPGLTARITAGETRLPVMMWLRAERREAPALAGFDSAVAHPPKVTEVELSSIRRRLGETRAEATRAVRERVLARVRQFDLSAQADPVSPVVQASLTPAQIEAMQGDADVVSIDRADLHPESMLGVVADSLNLLPEVHDTLGLRGSGVQIAQIERYGLVARINPAFSQANSISNTDGTCEAPFGNEAYQHATNVAGVMMSYDGIRRGVAPEAQLWAGGGCNASLGESQLSAEQALAWGATVFNLSYGNLEPGEAPGVHAQFWDEKVYNLGVFVAAAAGNYGKPTCVPAAMADGQVTSPGIAYNVMAVGMLDDGNSVPRYDDVMDECSSWRNPSSLNGDREKPDVVAPGTSIDTTMSSIPWFGARRGTSMASPVVAGTAALLQEAQPWLKVWPEVIRAVVMATATYNLEGDSRLSEYDGAGAIDPEAAVRLVKDHANGFYHGLDWTCASPWPMAWVFPLTAGRRTRVALAWGQDPDFGSYTSQMSADLDLEVVAPDGSSRFSASYDNSYEIVDFWPSVSGMYTVNVHMLRCTRSPRRTGLTVYQVPVVAAGPTLVPAAGASRAIPLFALLTIIGVAMLARTRRWSSPS